MFGIAASDSHLSKQEQALDTDSKGGPSFFLNVRFNKFVQALLLLGGGKSVCRQKFAKEEEKKKKKVEIIESLGEDEGGKMKRVEKRSEAQMGGELLGQV